MEHSSLPFLSQRSPRYSVTSPVPDIRRHRSTFRQTSHVLESSCQYSHDDCLPPRDYSGFLWKAAPTIERPEYVTVWLPRVRTRSHAPTRACICMARCVRHSIACEPRRPVAAGTASPQRCSEADEPQATIYKTRRGTTWTRPIACTPGCAHDKGEDQEESERLSSTTRVTSRATECPTCVARQA